MTHFLYHSSLLYGSKEEPPQRAKFKFTDHIGEDFLIKQYSNMECWLHRKHPDGQWVTMRIVTAEELDKYFNTALAKWIENAGVVEDQEIIKSLIWTKGGEDHFYTLDVEVEIIEQNDTWNNGIKSRKVCRLINKSEQTQYERHGEFYGKKVADSGFLDHALINTNADIDYPIWNMSLSEMINRTDEISVRQEIKKHSDPARK